MASASDYFFDPVGVSLAAGTHAGSGAAGAAGSGGLDASTLAHTRHISSGVPPPGQALTVAYQGEPGAYSEQAVRQMFAGAGFPVTPLPCASFSAVFDAVASGAAQHCMVPIENSLGGSIHDNYDLLLRHKLALPGVRIEDIKTCYSHPQALAQCEEYLSKLNIAPSKQYDTAGSAKIIAEQGLKNVAAIASELAASTYGLNVLARRIEDDDGNFTRFLLLAPATTRNQQALYFQAAHVPQDDGADEGGEDGPDASTGGPAGSPQSSPRPRARSSFTGPLHPNVSNLRFNPSLTRTTFKTSLVFTLPDAPGTLFKALSVFALRDMHLCKIESRPSKHVNFLKGEETKKTFAGAKANQTQNQSHSPPATPVAGAVSAVESVPSISGGSGGDSSSTRAATKFEYLFFIDTLSSLSQNESLKNGVRHLKEYAPFLRVLGSYPVFQALATLHASTSQAGAAAAALDGGLLSPSSHARTASQVALAGDYARRPLRIGIHGFGTFGQFLAKRFVNQGHHVSVHSRSDYSALAAQLGVEWVSAVEGFAAKELDVLILSMSILSFEGCVAAFPWGSLRSVLVVDVLSVKEHPKRVLLDFVGGSKHKSLDILCTHPMFGPESGKTTWKGLAMMYDKVRVAVDARAEAFLQCFSSEGCRMLSMSCELHDEYAAGSQFLTHTTGRLLGALNPTSTPINTTGYAKLLQLVENTHKDSWELYAGLYKFNRRSQEQLEKMAQSFDALRAKLKKGMGEGDQAKSAAASVASSSASGSAAAAPTTLELNPTVVAMNESATVAMADRAKSLVASGVSVIQLGVGEVLSVKTPEQVISAAVAALQAGHTTYTSANGMLPLREAICSKLLRENGLSYTASQIVVCNGAKQAIYQTVASVVVPGVKDEVIIPSPFWVSYPDIVSLVGGRPRIVDCPAEAGYILRGPQLEAAITPRTRMLILCSPSNPTGAVYSKEQLQELVDVLERHPHVLVLSDEIYEHLLFNGARHYSIASFSASMYRRTVVINGMSKGYVMTGFRLGFLAAGDPRVAQAANKVQGQITSCASSISQHAALAALTQLPPEFRRELVATLAKTRGLLLAALRSIPHTKFLEPQGAFYVLLDVSSFFGAQGTDGRRVRDSDDMAMYLLEVYRVALVPGKAFGAPKCLRISYASSDEIVLAGAAAIAKALQELTR